MIQTSAQFEITRSSFKRISMNKKTRARYACTEL